MPYRTLDIAGAAHYLHLSQAEVEQLVKDQEIPCHRHGDRVVFRRNEIDAWASQRILSLEGRRLAEYHRRSSEGTSAMLQDSKIMPELIRCDHIAPELPAKTKASVLREMTLIAERTGRVYDRKGLLESLEEREALCSTGLPGGLALLHPRHHDPYLFESPFLLIGRTTQQIPFGAPDGRGTDLFFLLCCPDDRLHLHALARLCVMVQKTGLLETLRAAPDADSMLSAVFQSEEEVLAALAAKA